MPRTPYPPNTHLQRHREARGETQEEFAEAIRDHAYEELRLNLPTSPKVIANWERGRSRPDPTYRRILRSLLQTDNAGLGLTPGGPAAIRETPRAYTGTPEKGNQREVEEDMRRDAFLRGGGALMAGLLIPPSPYPSETTAQTLTEEWLTQAEQRFQSLLLASHRDGAMAHFGAVAAHTYDLTHVFQQTSPWHALRPRLASATAVACYQAGVGVEHQLHHRRAEDWFLKSANFAAVGQDEDLYSAAVCRSAAELVQQDQPHAALARVMELPSANPRRRPTVGAWHVAIELGVVHTALGNGEQALWALDRADTLAETLHSEPPGTLQAGRRQGISAHWRGDCLTKLGHKDQARQALERDAKFLPEHMTTGHQSRLLTNLADVEAQDGAVDAAAHRLGEAWRVARSTDSLRGQAHIREVRAKLPPASASRSVQELDEVLTSA